MISTRDHSFSSPHSYSNDLFTFLSLSLIQPSIQLHECRAQFSVKSRNFISIGYIECTFNTISTECSGNVHCDHLDSSLFRSLFFFSFIFLSLSLSLCLLTHSHGDTVAALTNSRHTIDCLFSHTFLERATYEDFGRYCHIG